MAKILWVVFFISLLVVFVESTHHNKKLEKRAKLDSRKKAAKEFPVLRNRHQLKEFLDSLYDEESGLRKAMDVKEIIHHLKSLPMAKNSVKAKHFFHQIKKAFDAKQRLRRPHILSSKPKKELRRVSHDGRQPQNTKRHFHHRKLKSKPNAVHSENEIHA